MTKKPIPSPQNQPSAAESSLAAVFAPITSKTKMTRCASPLAYCPLYTAPTPGATARIPANAGFGPLLPAIGGGGGGGKPPEANPGVPVDVPAEAAAGTPSIFAPRQSSQ